MQKAIVLGATGMVGTQLILQLLNSDNYSEILSLVRKPSGIIHSKLTEEIVDFNHPESWATVIHGDVLFSTMGTTLAKAGSKKAQFEVDYHYQYNTAKIAAENGVKNYVLVSSAGAKASTGNFYMSMKGKLDDAVKLLSFESISILQPGQLDGNRKESRWTEKAGLSVMYALNKIGLLKKYRPIHANEVATAMINAATKTQSGTYALNEVFELSAILPE